MEATVLQHPTAWPEEMNEAIEAAASWQPTNDALALADEMRLRSAIDAFLDTHSEMDLEDLVDEVLS